MILLLFLSFCVDGLIFPLPPRRIVSVKPPMAILDSYHAECIRPPLATSGPPSTPGKSSGVSIMLPSSQVHFLTAYFSVSSKYAHQKVLTS